jgi:hypothetical protein
VKCSGCMQSHASHVKYSKIRQKMKFSFEKVVKYTSKPQRTNNVWLQLLKRQSSNLTDVANFFSFSIVDSKILRHNRQFHDSYK